MDVYVHQNTKPYTYDVCCLSYANYTLIKLIRKVTKAETKVSVTFLEPREVWLGRGLILLRACVSTSDKMRVSC